MQQAVNIDIYITENSYSVHTQGSWYMPIILAYCSFSVNWL